MTVADPDVVAEIIEALVAAWEAWDERPGLPETAAAHDEAIKAYAAAIGYDDEWVLVAELLAVFRRREWERLDAVLAVGRALDREEVE